MKATFKFRFILIVAITSLLFNKEILSIPINPYINTVLPTLNAVSVNKSSNITIIFTQEMNPSTIINGNIKIFGYQTGLLPCTIDYNAVTKTATINPNIDFKNGEIVSVTLTNLIKTSVNEIITPFVYTFRVQAIGGNAMFTRTSGLSNFNFAYIKAGDINGDGDIDLLINNKIYNNDGLGTFTFWQELSLNGIPELADFDNDGRLDILIQIDSTV
ncbi:MAG: Ig-like domain-containing protein, partial [Bacteroidota bacterium]|nr:Ig-like domain-containing protein [Bacteroidota bacterium]